MMLDVIKLELKDITEYMDAYTETKKGDEFVGVMDEYLKKLFTLWMRWQKLSDEATTSAKYAAAGQRGALLREAVRMLGMATVAKKLFWVETNEKFREADPWGPEWTFELRAGHKIVRVRNTPPSFLDFLNNQLMPPQDPE